MGGGASPPPPAAAQGARHPRDGGTLPRRLERARGAPGGDPPPRCYVFFRSPRGHRGGPAKVSFGEINLRRGVYGDPTVNFGKNADAGGRVYVEGRDGRLQPPARQRRT
jgi:hypothetical protein